MHVRGHIICSFDKPREKAMFSRIASHISEVGGSHGQDVINGFKVLWSDAPAMSVVGIVKGLMLNL